MENENIKRNDGFEEETEIKEETLKAEETEETVDAVAEDVLEEEDEAGVWLPDTPERSEGDVSMEEETSEEDKDDEPYAEEEQGEEWRPDGFVEAEPVIVELSEEEIAAIEAFEKKQRKKWLIISGVIAACFIIIRHRLGFHGQASHQADQHQGQDQKAG